MTRECKDRGQDRRAEDPRKRERHQSEGDVARREAAGLAPPSHARHDDARRPAQCDPSRDGWRDCHLHAFDIGGEQFGDPQTADDVADENRPTLNDLLRSSVVRFGYTYDFGDDWEHTIAFEKSGPAVEGQSYPVCIAGKRNCPPEDCGGVSGYAELLAALANPADPEHNEQKAWIGEEFDPDKFDLELANTMLTSRFKEK